MGSRIPGIFIWPFPHDYFEFSFQLGDGAGDDGDYGDDGDFYQFLPQLNTWYEIVLYQIKEENNGIVNVSYIYICRQIRTHFSNV